MIQLQVAESAGDYIVEAYIAIPPEMSPRWRKVINFGERQGDAFAFKLYDWHDMKIERLVAMIKAYDGVRKKRIKKGSYQKI